MLANMKLQRAMCEALFAGYGALHRVSGGQRQGNKTNSSAIRNGVGQPAAQYMGNSLWRVILDFAGGREVQSFYPRFLCGALRPPLF